MNGSTAAVSITRPLHAMRMVNFFLIYALANIHTISWGRNANSRKTSKIHPLPPKLSIMPRLLDVSQQSKYGNQAHEMNHLDTANRAKLSAMHTGLSDNRSN